MQKQEILVVEDDEDINRLLRRVLDGEGYAVTSAYSGSEAKLLLDAREFDLVLLDLMIPGCSGEDLLREMRVSRTMPVIVLSAKTALEDKVALLKLGADDYMVKPFELAEVTARVEAQLRRHGRYAAAPAAETPLRAHALTLDPASMRAEVNGQEVAFTAREFGILQLLLGHPERVFTREALYREVWSGEYYGEDNTVNVHISNIRQKLQKADPGREYIKTVWGIGFKLN